MAGVEYDHSFEIRIIGDSGVGKSSLIYTFDGEDNNVKEIPFGDYAKYNVTRKVLEIGELSFNVHFMSVLYVYYMIVYRDRFVRYIWK